MNDKLNASDRQGFHEIGYQELLKKIWDHDFVKM